MPGAIRNPVKCEVLLTTRKTAVGSSRCAFGTLHREHRAKADAIFSTAKRYYQERSVTSGTGRNAVSHTTDTLVSVVIAEGHTQ